MKLDVKFSESNQSFDPKFGEVHNISDGGYERGYAEGYDVGNTEGYTKGHTEGVEAGIEQGYGNGMDAIVNQTVVSYGNDTIKQLAVSFFQNNKCLESISLPKVTHLNGFMGCSALKNCDFSGAVYIQSGAFQNCVSLERIEFPSAEQFHSNVFSGCTSLKTLILRRAAGVASLGNTGSFTDTPIANGTGFIYVPDNLVERYKSAANWSTYAEQIKPISELEGA